MSALITLWAMNPDWVKADGDPLAVLPLIAGPFVMFLFMMWQGERDFRKLRRNFDD